MTSSRGCAELYKTTGSSEEERNSLAKKKKRISLDNNNDNEHEPVPTRGQESLGSEF